MPEIVIKVLDLDPKNGPRDVRDRDSASEDARRLSAMFAPFRILVYKSYLFSLLDDKTVNKLLSYDGYTPAMRDLFPCSFLRAELLKAIKYPEISYRKFCGDENDYEGHKVNSSFIGMESKQNRAFIGLPLNRKQMLSHVQMCQFRAGLTFSQLVNFRLSQVVIFRLSLPVERQQLLAVLKVKGKNIRSTMILIVIVENVRRNETSQCMLWATECTPLRQSTQRPDIVFH